MNLEQGCMDLFKANSIEEWMYSNNAGEPYGYKPTNLILQYYPKWPACK